MEGKEIATELEAGRPSVKVIFTTEDAEKTIFEQVLPDDKAAVLRKQFMLDALAC